MWPPHLGAALGRVAVLGLAYGSARALGRHLHSIVTLDQFGRRATMRQQHLINLIVTAAFPLHQPEIVEKAS